MQIRRLNFFEIQVRSTTVPMNVTSARSLWLAKHGSFKLELLPLAATCNKGILYLMMQYDSATRRL